VLPGTDAALGSWRDRLSYVVTTHAGPHLHTSIGVTTTGDPEADADALLHRASSAARTPA
jgi:hypothetical protein